ncbi:MAG: AAA family ATPase [Oscillospiraceae bacterium]|nr:AAA family ATPase [Oscillospiraceae bacterium]
MEKLHLISAETLFYTPIDHPRMLIDGILSNGLAILSGDSKIGKSWMVLWFCLKISRGEPVWLIPAWYCARRIALATMRFSASPVGISRKSD